MYKVATLFSMNNSLTSVFSAGFVHMRMPESIEITNPMYLREDVDDEGETLERSFANDLLKVSKFS